MIPLKFAWTIFLVQTLKLKWEHLTSYITLFSISTSLSLSIFFTFSSFHSVSVVGSPVGAIHIPGWKIVRLCPNTIQPPRACRKRERREKREEEIQPLTPCSRSHCNSHTFCAHTHILAFKRITSLPLKIVLQYKLASVVPFLSLNLSQF